MAAPGLDLVLAVIWHDPPWKPWGMMVETYDGKARIDGVRDPKTEVAGRVEQALSVIEKERGCDGLAKTFKETFEKLVKKASERGDVASHEIQALVIPAAVYAALKACGAGEAGERVADSVVRAGVLMASRDDKLRCADTLASAVDRSLILYFDRYKRPARASRLELVNPFNPSHRIKLSLSIDVGVIAEFTVYYALALRDVVVHARQGEAEKAFRDAAFLLLEPYWLAAVKAWYGGEYYKYIPPADTRLPTHTVFDHANAALAALLWCGSGDKPEGLLAEVDLAGVQSWIQESRRLRDLWAASWLASLLAWKAVEGLVDEYGPGVLVQPPARLHPFLAARLVGRVGDTQLVLPGGRGEWLSRLLGLAKRWPVDPTVPSRLLIALPPEAGGDRLRSEVELGIARAWRSVLDSLAASLQAVLQVVQSLGGASDRDIGIPRRLVNAMKELEPPLAVRLRVYNVCEAFAEARRELEASRAARELASMGVPIDEAAKALFLVKALAGLAASEVEVKAPGRRLGRAYYNYYKEALKAWDGRPPTCTVCGRAPAVVDGDRLERLLHKTGAAGGAEKLSIISDVIGERLCPYCLAKRMLRRGLSGQGGVLAVRLVGLGLTEEARRALDFTTIDSYTSRTRLARVALEDVASSLAGLLKEIAGGEEDRLVEKLRGPLVGAVLAGNRFTEKDPDNYFRSAAESIIIEVTHDDRVYREAVAGSYEEIPENQRKQLKKLIESARKTVQGHRAKAALLLMDGDFMGSGVLAGRLGVRPCEYALRASRFYNREDSEKFSVAYELLVGLAGGPPSRQGGGGCNPCKGREPGLQSVVATLSYLFSVSRALAVQAALDRNIVERVGGMLVYAGGDDLLAVVPPAAQGGEGGIRFPVIDALVEARRAYWGLTAPTEELKGFNHVETGGVPVAVAPALAAHGRSGVAYIFDIGRPLWHALSHARELEELKDTVFRARLSRGSSGASCIALGRPCKDAVVVYNDSTGGALLPLTLEAPREARGVLGVAVLPEAAARLASATASRGGARLISPRAYYELLYDVAGVLWEVASSESKLAKELVWRTVERHWAAEEPDADKDKRRLELLKDFGLGEDPAYEVVVGHEGSPEALASPRGCGCLGLGGLLALQVVGAARALHASV